MKSKDNMRKSNIMPQAHFKGASFDSDFYRSQKPLLMMEAFDVNFF